MQCINKLYLSSSDVRLNGIAYQPPPWHQYRYGSLWLYLSRWLVRPDTNLINIYGDSGLHMNKSNGNKRLFLHSLATQYYVPDGVSLALGPFTTGCVKLQGETCAVTRQGGYVARFGRDFKRTLSYTCDIKSFDHVIIGIWHAWDGVTATALCYHGLGILLCIKKSDAWGQSAAYAAVLLFRLHNHCKTLFI